MMPTYLVTLHVHEDDDLPSEVVKAKFLEACEDAPISFDIVAIERES
ncbi:hypothetical protein NDR87_18730 [Nocardia sp. CDC159]|uniref:Uncharacterized protein n=1 Tax=Nocardia pulmonis TaxID=2951408 RepID=A0A9X2IZ13_9NOCA|nr:MULTISPECIES: hypothetical protein [Nocardia]MCM6776274.1 hypothetical protein [Nocardia pulmonis]MCM6788400.1 hypothetical protein [Nocardia sp. CDC159]